MILGKEKSLVVDLGMLQDDIICTHGYIDHVGRSGEFEHIDMSL